MYLYSLIYTIHTYYIQTLNILIRNTKCNKTLIIYVCTYFMYIRFKHNNVYLHKKDIPTGT